MGTASARPQNLYTYADQCTYEAQEVQSWLRSVLAPAIEEYLKGAAHQSSGVNVDIGAIAARVGVARDQLPRRIAAAYYTDRHVRVVGLLFQRAGAQQQPMPVSPHPGLLLPRTYLMPPDDPPGGQVSAPTSGLPWQRPEAPAGPLRSKVVVTTTDGDLETLTLQLAEYYARLPTRDAGLSEHLAEMAPYAQDPEFSAALLNELARGPRNAYWQTPLVRVFASSEDTNVALLVNGFASGSLDPKTSAALLSMMTEAADSAHGGPQYGGVLTVPFLNAIKGNPAAATEFAKALVHNPEAIKGFLAGAEGHQLTSQRLFLATMSLAAAQMSPGDALTLVKTIGVNWPKNPAHNPEYISPDNLRKLLPDLTAFLVTGLGRSIPPPSGDLQTWANHYGESVGNALVPYLAAIKDADLSTNDRNDYLKGMFQGTALSVLFVPLAFVAGPEAVAGLIAFELIMAIVVGAVQSQIQAEDSSGLGIGLLMKDHNANRDVLVLNADIDIRAGQLTMISTLINTGKVIDPSTGKPMAFVGGPEDVTTLNQVAAHPTRYRIAGSTGKEHVSVQSMLYAFRDGARYFDPSSDLAKLIYKD